MRSLGSILFILTLFLRPLSAQEQGLQANPADDLFELGQLAYGEAIDAKEEDLQQANYQVAERQFARFLKHYPGHPNSLKAWYYSASCHDALDQPEEAAKSRERIVSLWKTGKLVGLSALQLATHHFTKEDFEKAAPLYQLASEQAENLKAKQLARYQKALCFQKLDKKEETIAALEVILKDPESPYFGSAQKALAHYYRSAGKNEEAYKLFLTLTESDNAETSAEATLQAALLARDLKKEPETTSLFEKVLATKKLKKWHGDARLFLMARAAKEKQYDRVLSYFAKTNRNMSKPQRVKQLLLAIQAYEQTKQESETTALYQQLKELTPETKTGLDASYLLLSKLYAQKKPQNFAKEARAFLNYYQKHFPDDARLDNTRLMLAETEYARKRFDPAAKLYRQIKLENIDPANHSEVRYRLTAALRRAGDEAGASAALEDFLQHHRADPRAAHALAQRADAARSANNFNAALRDYEQLLSLTKEDTLTEYAWAQKAAIYKTQSDLPNLLKAHQELLRLFPDRSEQAQAASHFWIGWTHFRQEEFEKSLSPLTTARSLDASTFGKEATVHLSLARYSLEQQKELQYEVDHLHTNHPEATLPQNLYAWLGVTLAADHKFAKAWKYLPNAVNWDTTDQTKTATWLSYARAARETSNFKKAILAFNILLKKEANPFRQADYHYEIAHANFELGNFAQSQEEAQAALALKPQGGLNGKIRFLIGKLASAQGDDETALQHYVVVIELYNEDPDSRHRALEEAIPILQKKAGAEDLAQAERYQKLLKTP